MKTRILSLIALVALVLIVIGCGSPAAPQGSAPAPQANAPVSQPAVGQGSQPSAASGSPVPSAVPAPKIKNPGTVISANIAEPESLDPAWDYETTGSDIIMSMYNTLLMFKQSSVTELVGLLAAKWESSADGKTYTFTLRPEAKFHSSNPVKASDVAYSMVRGMIQDRASGPQWIMLQPFFGLSVQRFKDAEAKPGDASATDVVNARYNGDFAKACQALQTKIAADDDKGTVTMTLEQPYGPFLLTLANSWAAVLEKAAVAKLGGWDGDCKTAEKFNDPTAENSELFEKEVGSGPYKLERWDHGNEVSIVADENYWLKTPLWEGAPTGPARVKRYVVKVINEWGTRYSMAMTGDADIVNVPRANISQMEALLQEECDAAGKCTQKNPNGFMRVYKNLPQAQMDAIHMNWEPNVEGGNNTIGTGKLDGNGIPPTFFSNIHIRKAFNYCFDWPTYLKDYWKDEAIQAFGPILQGNMGYDPNQAHYTFNLDKCKAEFEAASKDPGYEGLMDKGFFIQYTYNTGSVARQTAGQILKDNLTKVNSKFKLGIADEPWPVFLRDRDSSRLPIYLSGWLEDYHDPHDWVQPFLSSGGNMSGTANWSKEMYSQLDTVINKAVLSTDKNERAKLYAQLQNMAYENALAIYVEQPLTRAYMQSWIKDYYFNPIYNAYWGGWIYMVSKGEGI